MIVSLGPARLIHTWWWWYGNRICSGNGVVHGEKPYGSAPLPLLARAVDSALELRCELERKDNGFYKAVDARQALPLFCLFAHSHFLMLLAGSRFNIEGADEEYNTRMKSCLWRRYWKALASSRPSLERKAGATWSAKWDGRPDTLSCCKVTMSPSWPAVYQRQAEPRLFMVGRFGQRVPGLAMPTG